MPRLLWRPPFSSVPHPDQGMPSQCSPAEKKLSRSCGKTRSQPSTAETIGSSPDYDPRLLQDLQDNEQLRRLVQLIAEALLTGKLASLGFHLGAPVASQSPQPTPVIAPVQSPSSLRPRSDLVLSPKASPKRAKQGHLEKRPCPKGCGRLFKPGNMTQHLPTCSGEPHAVQEQKKGRSRYVQAAGGSQTKL